jgi:hypothetical protein
MTCFRRVMSVPVTILSMITHAQFAVLKMDIRFFTGRSKADCSIGGRCETTSGQARLQHQVIKRAKWEKRPQETFNILMSRLPFCCRPSTHGPDPV